MTSDELASMYAEIVRGTPKAQSRFTADPDFDRLWDSTAEQVKAISDEHPHASFDIPNEIPGP